MTKYKFHILLLILFFTCSLANARLPQLSPQIVTAKMKEIMKSHASFKELSPELIKRTLVNFVEELDPNKTYLIEPDIHQWLLPTDAQIDQILQAVQRNDFSVFNQILEVMIKAIERRRDLEKLIEYEKLPLHVNPKEFKDLQWTNSPPELLERLSKIKALQLETSAKLSEDVREKALQRITKRQLRHEEEILNSDVTYRQNFILSTILKAFASALDTHTAYFTPDEAEQFMINVQQRLFGIGVQLRDDLNGFTIVKIVEGGPAAIEKALKVKDRIIAVNGEPVVGMDITEVVGLIRGEEHTPVTLTVIRELHENNENGQEKLDIVVHRGEVVLKETRYEVSFEPYGDGIIGYLRLYTFYQDPDHSSASDLSKSIKELMRDHHLLGLILDLRYNTGGLLSQAVEVAGLFITKGIVVSVKDHTGSVQHLRDLDSGTAWDGLLVVLVNRSSASASEIVAQTLQDYGRALIVGDDHTYGKGSFQTFTLNTTNKTTTVNPQGEFKVTRGRYYTVSGKTPQLTGVISDIIVPGLLSESDIGERYAKYPLANDQIKENFEDDLADVPFTQREKIRLLYRYDLQKKLNIYSTYLDMLKKNSAYRLIHNKDYQNFLKELTKTEEIDEHQEFGQNDLQLIEAFSIMKDLILLTQENHPKNG